MLTKELFDKIKKWYWVVDYKTHDNHYIESVVFSGRKPKTPKGYNYIYVNCTFGELYDFSNYCWVKIKANPRQVFKGR